MEGYITDLNDFLRFIEESFEQLYWEIVAKEQLNIFQEEKWRWK